MPKSRIMIQLEPETIEQVDKIRGAVPRAAWVRLLIEDRLNSAGQIQVDVRDAPAAMIASAMTQASVAQRTEHLATNREAAGSTPARRAGKGSPSLTARSVGPRSTDHSTAESPSRKPKTCKHTNQIRKLGRPYCTDCGEFV